MATYDIQVDSVGTGIRYELTEGESAKVFAGITVETTEAGFPAIIAYESNSAIEILGTVKDAGTGSSAVILGNALSEQSNSVTIQLGGSIDGGIRLNSFDSSVTNFGTIDRIYFASRDNDGNSHSTVENSGVISDETAIQRDDSSTEELRVINSGTMTGTLYAFYSPETTSAVDIVTNSGVIEGKLVLGGGADQYDGADGELSTGSSVDGGSGIDRMTGGAGIEFFAGGKGNDILKGGGGNDNLQGGLGGDTLTGGKGRDTFNVVTTAESGSKKGTYDLITDFSRKQDDVIKLFSIDANGNDPKDGKFNFIGNDDFSHENGELRYQVKGSNTFVYGDTNGDGKADLVIKFDDVLHFKDIDFML